MTTTSIKLSTKGQFVIPGFIRKALNLSAGDWLSVTLNPSRKSIIILPRKKVRFLDLVGSIFDDGKSYEEIWKKSEEESVKEYNLKQKKQ